MLIQRLPTCIHAYEVDRNEMHVEWVALQVERVPDSENLLLVKHSFEPMIYQGAMLNIINVIYRIVSSAAHHSFRK